MEAEAGVTQPHDREHLEPLVMGGLGSVLPRASRDAQPCNILTLKASVLGGRGCLWF